MFGTMVSRNNKLLTELEVNNERKKSCDIDDNYYYTKQ